jgi:SAM-dependent methyltransferase
MQPIFYMEANMTIWHDNDNFWETTAPFLFGERNWAAVPGEVDQLETLMELKPGSRILDMCCGPGRHSLEFSRRGFQVTGVDRTVQYLEKARLKAQEEKLSIEFIEDDMRTFSRPKFFDAAVMMFTSFGYFEDPAENQQVLNNLCRSLDDGGVFLIDIMGKEVLARIFRERDWREHEQDDLIFLEERKISCNWSWIDNRWIILQGTERREFHVSYWLYSAAELSQMLYRAGFGSVDVCGSLEGTPYDQNALRLVVIACK